MVDESLQMSRFDSNGTMVVNDKFLETFDPAGSNVTIKQLSNQNYVVSQCRVYRSLRIRTYDYSSETKLYELHPSINHPCNRHEKTKIMPISNNSTRVGTVLALFMIYISWEHNPPCEIDEKVETLNPL